MIEHTSSHWKKYNIEGVGIVIPESQHIRYFPEILLNKLYLRQFCDNPNVIDGLYAVLSKQHRCLDFNCAKTAVAIHHIISIYPANNISSVCVIGDGNAIFSSLWKSLYPRTKVTMINLKKILPYDKLYGGMASSEFEYVEAENSKHLFCSNTDLFVNIASMQEMTYDAIEYYFSMMRSSNGARLFYCVNRDCKIHPDGTKIEFNKYPWKKTDMMLLDQDADWYSKYPSKIPPFWHNVDGAVRERFVGLGV